MLHSGLTFSRVRKPLSSGTDSESEIVSFCVSAIGLISLNGADRERTRDKGTARLPEGTGFGGTGEGSRDRPIFPRKKGLLKRFDSE